MLKDEILLLWDYNPKTGLRTAQLQDNIECSVKEEGEAWRFTIVYHGFDFTDEISSIRYTKRGALLAAEAYAFSILGMMEDEEDAEA